MAGFRAYWLDLKTAVAGFGRRPNSEPFVLIYFCECPNLVWTIDCRGRDESFCTGMCSGLWHPYAGACRQLQQNRASRSDHGHAPLLWLGPETCLPLSGVVKLLIKPNHGKLTTSQVDRIINNSRFTGRSVCAGHPGKAFQIRYTSDPNFRGFDSFTVRATYGWENRVVIDTFTITVQ